MERTATGCVLLKETTGAFHGDNLKKRAHRLPRGPLLHLVDIKRDTPTNLRAIATRKGQFLCGAFSPQLHLPVPASAHRPQWHHLLGLDDFARHASEVR